MLRVVMDEGCSTMKQVLGYLGERFRVKLSLPDWYPSEQAAEFLFKYVCTGLDRLLGLKGAPVVELVVSRKQDDLGAESSLEKQGPFSLAALLTILLFVVVSFYSFGFFYLLFWNNFRHWKLLEEEYIWSQVNTFTTFALLSALKTIFPSDIWELLTLYLCPLRQRLCLMWPLSLLKEPWSRPACLIHSHEPCWAPTQPVWLRNWILNFIPL